MLSDKTGTLTQNVMGWVWASVGGTLYGKNVQPPSPDDDDGAGAGADGVVAVADGTADGVAAAGGAGAATGAFAAGVPRDTPHTIALDRDLRAALGGGGGAGGGGAPPPAVDPQVHELLTHVALCNTVVPSEGPDGSIQYQAASPDEEALVQGAAYLGYALKSRTTDATVIERGGRLWTYDNLALLEFNSDRCGPALMMMI